MKINYLATFFGSIILLFAACTKITSTDIGTDLIPAVDGVNTKDTTITVYAKNAGTDTISPTLSQIHVVGNMEDPLFGTTDARINFQLSLPSSNFYFESSKQNLFLDSVVLVLSYNGSWGDTTRPIVLHVNELDNGQTFSPDTTGGQYDSYIQGYLGTYNNTVNFTAATSLTDVPTTVYPTSLDDSIHVYKDSGINMIRIRLNDAFGTRLLNYDTLGAYKNDSSFHANVKGLQVYADQGSYNNALLKIGLTDPNTKLALYYRYHPKDSAATVIDTNVKYFTVAGDCAHSNYINRDRSKGEISTYIPPNNPTDINDDLIYLQAGPGTYATVTIDSNALATMRNLIIHRAELLIEQASDISDTYYTPPNLFLLAKNDTSRFVIPGFDASNVSTADAVFSSSYLANYGDFGGVPNRNTTNNSLYAFNISQYVQGVITKHNNQHPFVLYAPFNAPFKLYETVPYTSSRGYVSSSPTNAAGCGRVRLYGGDGDLTNSHRMRLHIVYSEPH